MERNIIFLDIDGVLNNHNTKDRLPNGLIGIDPDNVFWLDKLVELNNAEIVLSSTWRLYYSLSSINRLLKRRGYNGPFIKERTKDIIASYCRGEEIQEWLDRNTDGQYVRYVILDDDSDMLESQLNNFIHVNHVTGLIISSFHEAQAIFNEGSSR